MYRNEIYEFDWDIVDCFKCGQSFDKFEDEYFCFGIGSSSRTKVEEGAK